MKKFNRRAYHSLEDLWRDVRFPLKNREQVRRAMQGDLVSFPLRERLMLAVTAVNGCRYCSYYHAQEALKAGLPDEELQKMLEGVIDDAPSEELPALLYAQHWAESEGRPDPAAHQKLVDTYGPERAEAIETVLTMIRMGNLLGNTGDYWLYRLSFGRWGLTDRDRVKR
ncbi:MAG: carboxymuconolactone decarboxylase family protein [Candidatus Promineifilaceae bacterium]|jgi:AhpD family alkylhydroperoxidase